MYSPCLKALPNKHVEGEDIYIYILGRNFFLPFPHIENGARYEKSRKVERGVQKMFQHGNLCQVSSKNLTPRQQL
jgi:hypothetical protein